MQWIPGLLTLFFVLFVAALVLNAPLILVLLLLRNRLDRRYVRVLIAAGFAAASAYFIWRMEWFDMWRHGVPPIGYILRAFVPYTAALAMAGWFVGGLIAPRSARRT